MRDMPITTCMTSVHVFSFRHEIVAQQAEYLARGGRFIVPVPSPEII